MCNAGTTHKADSRRARRNSVCPITSNKPRFHRRLARVIHRLNNEDRASSTASIARKSVAGGCILSHGFHRFTHVLKRFSVDCWRQAPFRASADANIAATSVRVPQSKQGVLQHTTRAGVLKHIPT